MKTEHLATVRNGSPQAKKKQHLGPVKISLGVCCNSTEISYIYVFVNNASVLKQIGLTGVLGACGCVRRASAHLTCHGSR